MAQAAQITLKATEHRILKEAAGNGGRIAFPERLTASGHERMARLFARHALAEAIGEECALTLTAAGYRAVGLRPPRAPRMPPATRESAQAQGQANLAPSIPVSTTNTASHAPACAPDTAPASKRERVLDLLGREEGTSLDAIIAATGWLPHTTRATLSRLRTGGQAIVRSKRDDGTTTYRILPPEPASPVKRVRKAKPAAAVGAVA